MAEVPKVVQERLRVASAGVAGHPDADVLTAFAERSLPGLERDRVLEHLSRCGECREVVSLALPASELAQVPIPSTGGAWLTWPRMRWGFAAGGIVVVALLAIVLHRRQESMAGDKIPPPATLSQARNQTAPAPSLLDTEKEQGKFTASPPPTGNKEREERSRAPSHLAHNQVSVAPAPIPSYANRGPVAGSLAHGPKMGIQTNLSNQWQQPSANSFAPPVLVSPATPSAPAPASNQAVTGGSDALVQTQAAAPVQTADDLAVQSQALPQQVPQGGSAESKVDRAKPLETVIVDNSRKYTIGAAPSASRVRSAVAGAAQWTISSKGGLQRSLDRGATWQDVNVDQSNAPGGASLAFAKEQSSGEKQQVALKDQKQASSEPVFHALAANGPDVWAGGANGMLYHSLDAGVHWTRIVPLSSGITLSGDIVTVDFTDPQHGRVATSTSEIWITGDAGQSWQKR
jgi:Photosynthesis system II assembly factor YCF48/Putative zinc-finger